MALYADSKYSVRSDLDAIHEKHIDQLGDPGTWGTATQRLAVASEIRQACYDAGVQEKPDDPGYESDIELPPAARELIRDLTLEPQGFNEESYNAARSGGLSDEEYVEMIGIIARLTCMDVFARGIGVPLRPLPEPRKGNPSGHRPATATKEHAWVPTVPNLPEGGDDAKEMYGDLYHPYIMRSVSLVPEEMDRHKELENIQYLPMEKILIKDYEHHEGFTRAQAETVAGRVSAINECFY